jgi:hypothetical protein
MGFITAEVKDGKIVYRATDSKTMKRFLKQRKNKNKGGK